MKYTLVATLGRLLNIATYMRKLADFHIHPDFSKDASGSIDEYCLQAVEIGLDSICFTTHYDKNPNRTAIDGYMIFDGKELPLSPKSVSIYLNEIDNARDKFHKNGLSIFSGIEIDYFPGVENEVEKLKSDFPFDFILGSVHCLDDISISSDRESRQYWESRTAEQMTDEYFSMLNEAASCVHFDALGHLDYHMRFAPKYYGDNAYSIPIEKYDLIFHTLIKNNIGIEINTKPYQSDVSDFHPSKNIIKRAIEFGVKISSIGSDCHQPGFLGVGIKEAYDFLDEYKIKPEFPKI
jgi:histidinol-phosphatase (PHP family)